LHLRKEYGKALREMAVRGWDNGNPQLGFFDGVRDVEGIDSQGRGNNTVTAVSLVYSIILKGSVRKVSTAEGILVKCLASLFAPSWILG
jgi:hypothetical protein